MSIRRRLDRLEQSGRFEPNSDIARMSDAEIEAELTALLARMGAAEKAEVASLLPAHTYKRLVSPQS